MGNRTGIELVRYAAHMLDHCNESFNQRFNRAEDLLKIADACQKSEWDFYPDDWTERQLQECIQFGIIPKWKEETTPNGGTKYVPDYRNESEEVREVAVTFMVAAKVSVNSDTLNEAIEWVKTEMPTPFDAVYILDTLKVDEAITKELNTPKEEDEG